MNFRIASIAALIVLVLGTVVSCSGVSQVDNGHRGIKLRYGKVVEGPLTEGIYFYNPFIYDMVQLDTRTQLITGQVTTVTKDVQNVSVSYSVNYNLLQDSVVAVYKNTGTDYVAIRVTPLIEAAVKRTVGQFEAVELVNKRASAQAAIQEFVFNALKAQGIGLSTLELQNIAFSDDFMQAVEAKVTAVQLAEKAENDTVRITEESKQKVIEAQAQAQSIQMQGDALANSPKLVEYEWVKKWNGVMPTTMLGAGAATLINLPTQKNVE